MIDYKNIDPRIEYQPGSGPEDGTQQPICCRVCGGIGEHNCPICGGMGDKYSPGGTGKKCSLCNGEGVVDCKSCNGTGEYKPVKA